MDALKVPEGFRRVAYDGLSRCTLDGAIEQPALVVAPSDTRFSGELWSACTRVDTLGHKRGEPGYNGNMPYWHPLVRANEETAAFEAAVG